MYQTYSLDVMRGRLAISGFTKSGEPKTFFPALARHLERTAPETRITLLSGASLAKALERWWAEYDAACRSFPKGG